MIRIAELLRESESESERQRATGKEGRKSRQARETAFDCWRAPPSWSVSLRVAVGLEERGVLRVRISGGRVDQVSQVCAFFSSRTFLEIVIPV